MNTREYEGLFILKAAGQESEVTDNVGQLEGVLKKNGAEITNATSWGRRQLAYPIDRHTEGYYHLVRFNSDPATIKELDRLFRLNEQLVRFMLLTAEGAAELQETTSSAERS